MESPFQGIYYVKGAVLFPTQIVVSKELNPKAHIWLKALSNRLERQDMEELLEKIETIKRKFDRELAESVLEVSVRANQRIVEELRGDDPMCQALLEIMEPEINKIKEDAVAKTKENDIICAVKSFRDWGANDSQIKEALMKNYRLPSVEAEKYL